MKKLILVSLLALSGCRHMESATSLIPANPADPSQGVWAFIISDDNGLTGVWRCKEVKGPKDTLPIGRLPPSTTKICGFGSTASLAVSS